MINKICFISDAGSYHTKKWCDYFCQNGYKVSVISFTPGSIPGADVRIINTGADARGSEFGKLRYLFQGASIRKLVAEINPDIINVHYATSYGTAVALSGIRGYILSVWGADVYDFPKKSIVHKSMLRYSLSKADIIFSTSKAMADETKRYTDKEIFVTPFGVDMKLFNPDKRDRCDAEKQFIVGTVKALTPKYGIDYLLKAISIVKLRRPDIPLCIRIAGKGEYEDEYKHLSEKLGVSNLVNWLGFISQEEAAHEWANMDVAVVPSTLDSESFGVSAVEAEACSTPVIISDVPGLMEATSPGKSSIVVPRCDEEAMANAIIDLFDKPEIRTKMGSYGRYYVEKNYEVKDCFANIEQLIIQYYKSCNATRTNRGER